MLVRTALIRIVTVLLVAAVATSCGTERVQPKGGRFLVYTRHLNTRTQAVWIARVDGTQRRLLVRQGIFGALSPDGRWVAYSRCLASQARCQTGNAPFALFLIGTSGGKPQLLARSMSYPSWSPRSDRIVGLRKNALASVDLHGNLRVLEKSPATAGWSFSPDGAWVVYAKARQHTRCDSDLFVVRATGGEERRLTRGRDIFPVWGQGWIAFSRSPKSCAYARRIWQIRSDGSGSQPVTAPFPGRLSRNGYYGMDPIDWTPDGRVLLGGLSTEWGPGSDPGRCCDRGVPKAERVRANPVARRPLRARRLRRHRRATDDRRSRALRRATARPRARRRRVSELEPLNHRRASD